MLLEIILGLAAVVVVIGLSAKMAVSNMDDGSGRSGTRRHRVGAAGGNGSRRRHVYHIGSSLAPAGGWDSGLVTVNETDGSQLFYWFFPPQSGDPAAPVILWLQGGPGASALIGLFLEIGPYSLRQTVEGHVMMEVRNATWARDHGLLFVDSPVGTGYSHAGSPAGYATTEEEVASSLHSFLQVFFTKLHPELAKNDFYIIAESYGGHFAPNLAVYILEKNRDIKGGKSTDVAVNLQGVGIQNGLVDPAVQELEKPYAAYFFGLIDNDTLKVAVEMSKEASRLALSGDYTQALIVRTDMEDLIRCQSGINLLDVREFGAFNLNALIEQWANEPANIKALRLPKGTKWGTPAEVKDLLTDDVMRSYAYKVQLLLEEYKMRVLLFQGQFDLKDGVRANLAWIKKLKWSGQEAFLNSTQERWFVANDPDRPAGWAHEVGLLTEVVVSGAGHLAPMTQPESCLDCISRWIKHQTFRLPEDREQPMTPGGGGLTPAPHS